MITVIVWSKERSKLVNSSPVSDCGDRINAKHSEWMRRQQSMGLLHFILLKLVRRKSIVRGAEVVPLG